jgi:hypothetical protein
MKNLIFAIFFLTLTFVMAASLLAVASDLSGEYFTTDLLGIFSLSLGVAIGLILAVFFFARFVADAICEEELTSAKCSQATEVG